MTSVRQAVLTRFDRKLLFVQRKIIVFLDNAKYYPESIMDSLSQINIFFLPMNTRSRLQSLDAGIIQNFKIKYREGLVKYEHASINENSSATQIIKGVDILMVSQWTQEVWKISCLQIKNKNR